jgi:hypothetical protein
VVDFTLLELETDDGVVDFKLLEVMQVDFDSKQT